MRGLSEQDFKTNNLFNLSYEMEKKIMVKHKIKGESRIVLAVGLVVVACVVAAVIVIFRKPTPATFEVSNLTFDPSEIEAGESVKISFTVKNVGDLEGTFTGTLKIDDEIEATKKVTLSGGGTQIVSFTVIKDTPGTYEIEADGLQRFLEVLIPDVIYGPTDAPAIPDYIPEMYEDKPTARAYYKPWFNFSLICTHHHKFEKVGGLARVKVKNEGGNALFVYRVGASGDWQEEGHWYSKDVGFTVEPGEEQDLGLVRFLGPEMSGRYKVKFGISILAKTGVKWYDYGTKYVEPVTYDFENLAEERDVEYEEGGYDVFNKLNELVNPRSSGVYEKALQIAGQYSGEYNVYQLCALFNWVRDEIEYVSDPGGIDYWSPPDETLVAKSGDCEDHAILLTSMIEAIGGATRIILIENHAFVSVYIGDESHASKVIEAIKNYYDVELPFVRWVDNGERWLILESTGGYYPGDLPVGAKFTLDGWTFTETQKVYFVDII